MTRTLNRLAEWSVVDGLVTDVYRETALLPPGEPVRGMMREAVLSLTVFSSLDVAHAKLATLGYLFRSASDAGLVPGEVVTRMLERILDSARALSRFTPGAGGSEPAPASG